MDILVHIRFSAILGATSQYEDRPMNRESPLPDAVSVPSIKVII